MFSSRVLISTVVAAAVIISSLAACEPAGSDPSRIAPGRGALFGIYLQPGSRDATAQKQQITSSESMAGRRYDIIHTYDGWTDPFPGWRESWLVAGGRTPLISWAGPSVGTITSGSQDGVINARAKGLKSFGKPVLVRWFWEMDGARNRTRAVSPSAFKAAWRRIVTKFRAAGATNAEFVWCPTAYGFVTGEAQKWYPGDDVVDWTCSDGYNWYPGRAGDPWKSFEDIFKSFYGWAAKKGKPMMVGEFGAMEDPAVPGRKAQWLDNARYVLKTRFPLMRAVVYFHGDGDVKAPYPWYITSSESSKAAWRRWGLDGYFRT